MITNVLRFTPALRRRSMIALALSVPAAIAFALGACANGSDGSSPASAQPTASGAASAAPAASSATSASPSSTDALDAGAAPQSNDAGQGDYTYGAWSDWSNCSETCDAGVKTRTRDCTRGDGIAVNCAHCGGECTETQACSATICCAPRNVCCPTMPYNVVGGSMTWCSDTLSGYAKNCLDAGCLWTGATACTAGGSPSNATLPGGQGTCQ